MLRDREEQLRLIMDPNGVRDLRRLIDEFDRSLDAAESEKQRQMGAMNSYLGMLKRYKAAPQQPAPRAGARPPSLWQAEQERKEAELLEKVVDPQRILELSDEEESGMEIDTKLIDGVGVPDNAHAFAVVIDQSENGPEKKKVVPLKKLKKKQKALQSRQRGSPARSAAVSRSGSDGSVGPRSAMPR